MALVRGRNLELLQKTILDDKIVDCKNYAGETPLHIASRAGDIRIVNFLIENKAFVNSKNKTGETPLFYAVAGQHMDVIDALIKMVQF